MTQRAGEAPQASRWCSTSVHQLVSQHVVSNPDEAAGVVQAALIRRSNNGRVDLHARTTLCDAFRTTALCTQVSYVAAELCII